MLWKTNIFRRKTLRTIVFGPITCAFSPEVLAQGTGQLAVRLRIDDSVLQTIPSSERVRLSITQDSSSDAVGQASAAPASRGLPLIFIAIGVLSAPLVWQSIVEMTRQTYYGGVIIDARHAPVSIINSRSIQSDLVIFIHPDGRSENFRSHEFSRATLARLLSGLGVQ
jgi:hypothetical protein